MRRHPLSAILLPLSLLLPACAAAGEAASEAAFEPVTAILVRHAEKAAEPAEDPGLTAAGRARAEELARMLAESGVTAIYATDRRRTQETVQPLAERLGLPVEVLPAADVAAVARALLSHPGGVVVSAGHSNTVGEIIELLGGGSIPAIDDSEYGGFYAVTVCAPGEARVLSLRYGEPSPR